MKENLETSVFSFTGRQYRLQPDVSDLLTLVCDRTRLVSDRCLAECLAEILLDKMESLRNVDEPMSTAVLNTKQRSFVEVFLTTYRLLDKDYFNYLNFAKTLCAAAPLSIELIWHLHRPGILELSLYLTLNDSNVATLNHFSRSLSDIICGQISAEFPIANNLVTDVCVAMLSRIMPIIPFLSEDKAWANSRKVISQILNDVTRNVMDSIYSDNAKEKQSPENDYLIMYELVRKSIFMDSWLKEFCVEQLTTVLSYRPSSDSFEAITMQELWTFNKSSPHLVNIFVQLLIPLSAIEAMDVLRQLVSKKTVNWRASLTFIATAVVRAPDTVPEFNNIVGDLLNNSFDNLDSDSLMSALLFARQASLEETKLFPSYGDWFQATFARQNNSMIDKKKTFTFFIEFLTNLIPYEPYCFLKVHLTRPPRVVPKCHHLYSNYTACARTKIWKLKGSKKDAIPDNTTEEDEKAESEVENALTSFSATGKIPAFIMQMSIFHKKHYTGKFLNLLLKPRQLPTNPDTRMNLIDALFKSSKISPSTHSFYLNSCNKQGTTHLVKDATIEELERNIMTEEIGPLLVSAINENNSKDALSLMTKLSQRVTAALSGENLDSPNKYLVVNMPDHPPSTSSIRVLNLLLNTFCKVSMSLKTTSSLKWERDFIELLVDCNPSVHRPLCLRLWELLIGKDHLRLSSTQILAVARFVFYLRDIEHKFPLMKFANESADDDQTFVSRIGDRLNLSTEEEKLFSLSFLNGYFSTMVADDHITNIGKVPQHFVTKFDFLCAQYSDRAEEEPQFHMTKLIRESEFFERLFVVDGRPT